MVSFLGLVLMLISVMLVQSGVLCCAESTAPARLSHEDVAQKIAKYIAIKNSKYTLEADKKPYRRQHFLIIKKKSETHRNDEKKERVKKEEIVRSVMELLKTYYEQKRMKTNQLYRI